MIARRGLLPLVATALTGCVYFNTFYNAERYYSDGERLVREHPVAGEVPPQARTAFEKAAEKASTVVASHPDSKYADDALLLLGKAHERLGNYTEATLALEALLRDHTESELAPEATLWLARSAREGGDAATARSAVERLRELGELSREERFEADLEEAWLALDAGEGDRALALLEELQQREPDLARRHDVDLVAARARLDTGDPREALVELRTALAAAGTPERQRRTAAAMAEALASAGVGPDAREAYQELLQQGLPDSLGAAVEASLAASHAAAGDTAQAIEAYAAAARRLPSTPLAASALYRRGLLQWHGARDRAAARETFLEAYLESPESAAADSAVNAARTITEIEHYQSIVSGSERVPSPLPQDEVQATATYLLAELLYTAEGDEAGARELFEAILVQHPQSAWAPKVLYTLGWLDAQPAHSASAPSPHDERLLREFPDTEYAAYARQRLGIAPVELDEAAGSDTGSVAAPSETAMTTTVQVPEEAAAPAAAPADSAVGDPAGVAAGDSAPAPAAGDPAAATASVATGEVPPSPALAAAMDSSAAEARAAAGPDSTAAAQVLALPAADDEPVRINAASARRGSVLALPPDQAQTTTAPPVAQTLDAKLLVFSRALPRAPDPLLGIQDRLLARRREEAAEERLQDPAAARAAEVAAERAGGMPPADTTGILPPEAEPGQGEQRQEIPDPEMLDTDSMDLGRPE